MLGTGFCSQPGRFYDIINNMKTKRHAVFAALAAFGGLAVAFADGAGVVTNQMADGSILYTFKESGTFVAPARIPTTAAATTSAPPMARLKPAAVAVVAAHAATTAFFLARVVRES